MYLKNRNVSDTIDITIDHLIKLKKIKIENIDKNREYLEGFIELFYKYNFIYDPYKEVFINPIILWEFKFNECIDLPLEVLENRLKELKQPILSKDIINELLKKFDNYGGNRKALYIIFPNFKWIGIILGAIISFYFNIYFGLSISLYLIYLSIGFFTKRNGLISEFEYFRADIKFMKHQTLYLYTSILLFILSLLFLYLNFKSILIVIVFFILHVYFFNKIIRDLLSIEFIHFHTVYTLEKKLEMEHKN
jgi:hypothetical protein